MKKSEVKLSDFGLPDKKKYPMPDEKHVKSAIRFFNYVDSDDEWELATNIKKKMKKYHISPDMIGDNNRLKRYMTETSVPMKNVDTIIFDFGGVLVHNEDTDKKFINANIPEEYVQEILTCMTRAYDNGDTEQFTATQNIEHLRKHLRPELKKYADAAWYAYVAACTQYPYTKELLSVLKSNGYKIYYLSNWDRAGHDQCIHNGVFDFLDVFDGGIFSYEVGLMKPDKRIYELLLKRYGIDPGTAVFLDDKKENIDTASTLGIMGILFTPDMGYGLLEFQQKKKVNRDPVGESSVISEGYLKSTDDIYYNKDKFDSGEINVCFITGHSGSGKTTMGRNMAKTNIEHYELDDVISNKTNFTMDNMKEYGDLIYSFFKGPGKEYWYDKNDIKNGTAKEHIGNYEADIIKDFINYTKSYAKLHKNTKYVIDGIWLFMFIEPESLKDYAVYIKGTSKLISDLRAAKRDSKNDFPDRNDKLDRGRAFIGRFKNFFTKETIDSERAIQKYRNYFFKKQQKALSEYAEIVQSSEYAEIVQSILEEPMIGSSKVFIINNMLNNTFVGVGYGDDTSIQRIRVNPDLDTTNSEINDLIKSGTVSVYEYIGPSAYAEMCITESAATALVSRDYFERVYVEVCSAVDAICEVTEATMWHNINTKLNPISLALLGEATLCLNDALKLPDEFEGAPMLEIHQDIDGYYLKNIFTEQRSKSRQVGSIVPYNTVKYLCGYKL